MMKTSKQIQKEIDSNNELLMSKLSEIREIRKEQLTRAIDEHNGSIDELFSNKQTETKYILPGVYPPPRGFR